MDSQRTRSRWLVGTALFLPPLAYLALVQIYAYNFPFLDDYGTVLTHALQTPGEQIKHWFVPHNEHIHLILKAAASFDLWIFGEINLVRHMWLGALIFILFYGLVLKAEYRKGISWVWLLPLPFLLFQPSYWGTITWSTTSLHNFPGLLFSFLALQLWNSISNRHKFLALLFTGLALLTNGFGLAVLATLILCETHHFWQCQQEQRPHSKTAVIGLSALTVAWIVFRITQGELQLLASINGNPPLEYIHFFTNFLGSCFHFLGSPWLNLIALAKLILFIWFIKQGLPSKHPSLFFFIVYLLMAAFLATLARTDLGADQGLASRYRIYSTLLLCCLYLGSVHLHWKQWRLKPRILLALVSLSIAFYTASLIVNLNNLSKIKQRLIADEQRWQAGEPIQEFLNPEDAKRILDRARDQGVFFGTEPVTIEN